MLSQSPGIYIILAAVVSGALLIINNLLVTSINNNFQLAARKTARHSATRKRATKMVSRKNL